MATVDPASDRLDPRLNRAELLRRRARRRPCDRDCLAGPPSRPCPLHGGRHYGGIDPFAAWRSGEAQKLYKEPGQAPGQAAMLLHGFPYDPRCYDRIGRTGARGARIPAGGSLSARLRRDAVPPVFRDAIGPASSIATDLLALMDGLGAQSRPRWSATIGAAAPRASPPRRPYRVRCLVTGNGYAIQDIAAAAAPLAPETEHRLWYQYYFHTPPAAPGSKHRREIGRLLWRLWSPSWRFDERDYARSGCPSTIPISSPSSPTPIATASAMPRAIPRSPTSRPARVPAGHLTPTIALWGADDGVGPPPPGDADRQKFGPRYERRIPARRRPQHSPGAPDDFGGAARAHRR